MTGENSKKKNTEKVEICPSSVQIMSTTTF